MKKLHALTLLTADRKSNIIFILEFIRKQTWPRSGLLNALPKLLISVPKCFGVWKGIK